MSIYVVKTGDTFDKIARKQTGIETSEGAIRVLNPGISEPLTKGQVLTVPGRKSSLGTGIDNDIVTISVDGRKYDKWVSVTINRRIDTPDTFSFTSPWDPADPEQRSAFQPLSFKSVTIKTGARPVLTGTMLNATPTLEGTRTVTAEGYSTPGVLNDCSLPVSALPFEFDDIKLDAVVKKVAAMFDVAVSVKTLSTGATFDQIAANVTDSAWSFLSKLAAQRGFLLGSDTLGRLTVFEPKPGLEVGRLNADEHPVISITPAVNPQGFFSAVTGFSPTLVGLGGEQFTVQNNLIRGVQRSKNVMTPDSLETSVKTATEAKASRMVADAVSYQVVVSTWRNKIGTVWAPGQTISVIAPDVMIYKRFKFMIRSVTLTRSADAQTATLDLVLPEVYQNKMPRRLPWD